MPAAHRPAPPLELFATAPRFLETLLAGELTALGAQEVTIARAGVHFTGGLTLAYRACLWSRIANRVLLRLARFAAPDAQTLYDGVAAVAWHEHLDPCGTLAVDCSLTRSTLTHTHFVAQKTKDAVVDQLRARFDLRPSVNVRRPDVRINLHVQDDVATLSIDLAGDSLHRRGYRQAGVSAPLKENVAAAVLLRGDWPALARAGAPLVDPMCGSGTLPIEAAFMAGDIAPGLLRDHFGFLAWRGHDAAAWRALLEEAHARRNAGLAGLPAILGYDTDPAAVQIARANVVRAGLAGHVHIAQGELKAVRVPAGAASGLLAVNPPYGERMGTAAEVVACYSELGQVLRQAFVGWKAAVLTADSARGKTMGLRARRMYTLYNGAIECRLLCFDVVPERFVRALRAPAVDSALVVPAAGGEIAAFVNRLTKRLRHLRRWAEREGVHCYRVYDADLPEYAVAVDRYEQWVHVQEYLAPSSIDPERARLRLQQVLRVLPELLGVAPQQVYLKVRQRQRGTAQYTRQGHGGGMHEVREGGCRFLVNFTDYLDTGLFLDHRLTRAMIRDLAAGRRFLNLFGYTGTATVYAAAGGAASTTTVDLSRSYLDWAQRNLALNGFGGARHALVQADCLEWLAAERAPYDLIFLDPPTFSNSKRMRQNFDVQRQHVDLILAALRRLTPQGMLIFSCNRRGFRLDAERLQPWRVEDLTVATTPEDFRRGAPPHRCWRFTRAATQARLGGRVVEVAVARPKKRPVPKHGPQEAGR